MAPRTAASRAPRKTAQGGSEARERLLRTASELFYAEGIHVVGVDRIVAVAGVTRATFYRHFPSKEDLVEAYLGVEDANIRGTLEGAHGATDDPVELVGLLIEGIAEDVARHHTRGCPFINAAVEYADTGSRVRRAVDKHRAWFRGSLEHVLRSAGADDPVTKAGQLVLLRDAALVGGYLDGWDNVRVAFVSAARQAAGLDPKAPGSTG
ncbi:TetR/AcrR family transcriptional regulator [Antribacter sp. KLBMP9083]|uniref:TetR/AcrR family transcriptional regulator n=1 Tax=Antribacter soli TaxID=2910976 RepID=A0AA41U935_9MICO|nr:TetR/AcrR family transcriptional regulator [Antribacter soli]MCF4123376.1 TetR/AcrR family transcriptional regulator [Antribacter soli]